MNLKKEHVNRTRYCVQYDDHSRMMCTVLCSLMEHQSLVDLAIRCGNNTIHAHKCVLAANSPYFREQLEKVPAVEQMVINGLDFAVVKSIVEFMYCGETNVVEDNFKYMVAASKLFQIRGIQALAADSHYEADENIQIPPPLFLSKKPKYSSTYLPLNNLNTGAPNMNEKIGISTDPTFHRKLKRKYMRTEAEKACAKEAAASRLALEALQKELATTDQISSFVIEESCTETTVENFIPNTEETFIDNLNQLEVVNYADLNASVLSNSDQILNLGKPVLQYDNLPNIPRVQETAVEKLKQILGGEIPPNVEIMFKTSDGHFVSLTEEVLQNITKESLQYQVIDEHGRAGEVQQLSINIKPPIDTDDFNQTNPEGDCEDPIAKYVNPIDDIAAQHLPIEKFEATTTEMKMADITDDQSILESIIESDKRENDTKNSDQLQKAMSDKDDATMELEIPSKNLQRSKLDSLKKRSVGVRKLRAMTASSEKQFCDEFLNTSIDLTEDTKTIYGADMSNDISCMEIMEPMDENVETLEQVGDGSLNKMTEREGKVSDDGSGDCFFSTKKTKKLEDEMGSLEYSPRKTRSNRQTNEMLSPENISDDKYDSKTKKIFAKKRNK